MPFVGDDWAEDHHDVELVDEQGTVLARRRLPEGLAGVTQLHTLVAEHLPDPHEDADPALQVMVGIETERGSWVASLVAAGYTVYAINPLSVARYRERHSTSGAKSDAADAHLLAEIIRVDRAHHRAVAGDSALAEGIKLAARSHQNLVWERTRHVLRLRSVLRSSFPLPCKRFRSWTHLTRWSCWPRRPIPTRQPACPDGHWKRPSPGPIVVTRRPVRSVSWPFFAPRSCTNLGRCRPPTPLPSLPRSP